MNANVEFLNYIHQNAEMGQDSINKLLEILKDSDFKNLLNSQFNEYKEIFDESEKILNEIDKEAKGVNKRQKRETELMISMKTLTNKSADHIAEMLMKGSLMGVIQSIRRLKQYTGQVNPEITMLAQRLLNTEERNLDECKKFLGVCEQ